MEEQNGQITLSDQQMEIMDELYFMISFIELSNLFHFSSAQLENEINWLLKNEMIQKFRFKAELNRHLPIDDYSWENANEIYFVATKKGLLLHNSR